MAWRSTNPMIERVRFISEVERAEVAFVDICAAFGISRKTGYKWLSRYQNDGTDWLKERSRAPKHRPAETQRQVQDLICEIRSQFPTWGSKKITARLGAFYKLEQIPARSTIDSILKRNGFLLSRQKNRRRLSGSKYLIEPLYPNHLWSVDFKGQFRLQNQKYCYPLTIVDNYSRMILACIALYEPTYTSVRNAFESLFSSFGIPARIRSDNGTPFASTSTAGLSLLSVEWIRLGIVPERIQPGSPQENGKHERMHRTLKAEATRPPKGNLRAQQQAFDNFLEYFNTVRPHEAIDQKTPQSRYTPSTRCHPKQLYDFVYPECERSIRLSGNGELRWFGRVYALGTPLAGQKVALHEELDGRTVIYFGPYSVAEIQPDGVLRRYTRLRDRFGNFIVPEQEESK